MRRWLHAVIALLTLATLTFSGRSYLYCHIAQEAMPVCCCAPDATDAATADDDAAAQLEASPCCARRDASAVAHATAKNPGGTHGLAPPPTTFADLAPRAYPRAREHLHAERSAVSQKPASARASPPRRGKARARLAVTLC